MLAGLIDIIDRIGEMAEMAAIRGQPLIPIPVIGQLNWAIGVFGRGHEHQCETATFAFMAAGFGHAQKGEKGDAGIQILHADHGMKVFQSHLGALSFAFRSKQPNAKLPLAHPQEM